MNHTPLRSSRDRQFSHAYRVARTRRIKPGSLQKFRDDDRSAADTLAGGLSQLPLRDDRYYRTTVGEAAKLCGFRRMGKHRPAHIDFALDWCGIDYGPFPLGREGSDHLFLWLPGGEGDAAAHERLAADDLMAMLRGASPLPRSATSASRPPSSFIR